MCFYHVPLAVQTMMDCFWGPILRLDFLLKLGGTMCWMKYLTIFLALCIFLFINNGILQIVTKETVQKECVLFCVCLRY